MADGKLRDPRLILVAALVLTVIAWQFPIGQLIAYPFTLLATFAHEMGHGVTAVLLGGHFDRFVMHPDGSGLASWRGDMGRIARGLIAGGGLVGPSIAGALILIFSRRWPRLVLIGLVLVLVAALVLVAGNAFTWAFIGVGAVALAAAVRFLPRGGQAFLVQLIGAQLCLALFRDVSYMFSQGGLVGGKQHLSDSAQIAEALFLPYWFWGGLAAVISVAVLTVGLWVALRPVRAAAPAPAPAK